MNWNYLEDVDSLLSRNPTLANTVLVDQSPDYPGNYLIQPVQESEHSYYYRTYCDWVSRLLILNEPAQLRNFEERLLKDGWEVYYDPGVRPLLEEWEYFSKPLEIEGLDVRDSRGNPSELFDYQIWGLNKALTRATLGKNNSERYHFFGWGTGTGKSLAAAAGLQELFNRDLIDVGIVCTLRRMKINTQRFINKSTTLSAVVNEHDERKRRLARYNLDQHNVFVMNYEKGKHDFDAISQMIKGKRVAFIFDEVQKILTDVSKTQARKGMDNLISIAKDPIIWPLTATSVSHSPLRYRDVFSLDQKPPSQNVLGSKSEFEKKYLLYKFEKEIKNPSGYGSFFLTEYKWDNESLHEVRHLVSDRVHSVRKTDPGISEKFKAMGHDPIFIQLSPEDRRLYNIIQELSDEAERNEENLSEYYTLSRLVCNTPEALRYYKSDLAETLVQEFERLCNSNNCAKLDDLVDRVGSIQSAGDKVVVFTKWTDLSLHRIASRFRKEKISFVINHGDLSDKKAQEAEDRFKEDPDVTVFLSSDAGSHGLSLQVARYVINYEPPYSYDILMQRSERINRADSYLDNLTAYTYITEGTVEERIWRINEERRKLAADTTGTKETLTYGKEEELSNREYRSLMSSTESK